MEKSMVDREKVVKKEKKKVLEKTIVAGTEKSVVCYAMQKKV